MNQVDSLNPVADGCVRDEIFALSSLLAMCDAEINPATLSHIESVLHDDTQIVKLIAHANRDKRLAQTIRECVRDKFAKFFDASELLKHAIAKPYGYPGDCWILEVLYNGNTISSSVEGQVIDRWCMGTALPVSVVERKDILRHLLQEKMNQGNALDILSIASGSAREIREIPIVELARHNVTLLDNDQRTFEFFTKSGGSGCELVAQNALNFDLKRQFDLVYSFGLFDYLPDRVLNVAMRCALQHLKPQGTFIFALKNYQKYTPALYDWFCDWRFVPRAEADLERLCIDHGLVIKELKKTKNEAVMVAVCERDGFLA